MTGDPRYSAEVLRRLRELPGAGEVTGPDRIEGRAGDLEQGAAIQFSIVVRGGRVAMARFRAFGCPHLIAAASWLTERLVGAGRKDLLAWDWQEVARDLEVPPAKFGRLLTLQDALRNAAGNWPGESQSTV